MEEHHSVYANTVINQLKTQVKGGWNQYKIISTVTRNPKSENDPLSSRNPRPWSEPLPTRNPSERK